MHFAVIRHALGYSSENSPPGQYLLSFSLVPPPLGQHPLCTFACSVGSGAASCIHFCLLRCLWGNICYSFLPALTPLGQHCLHLWDSIFYTFLYAPAPLGQHRLRLWSSISYTFLRALAPLRQNVLCIFGQHRLRLWHGISYAFLRFRRIWGSILYAF
jgi:hypothetical protein